jgi:DNA repair exonuclease SbcCD nuclease subunit
MQLWQANENQLFNKVACLTDIHWGRKGNDVVANQDNEDFVTWFIAEAKTFGADTIICLGDWHDHRNTISIGTMNFSLNNIERIAKEFKTFYMITGNHDLPYRTNRSINSVEFGRNIENCVVVKEPLTIGDVTILPWLVNDEWKMVPDIKSKYIFGHFELPTFFMNGMTEMPDHGELKHEHFKHQDYAFSGHFHKRQARGKVIYIGNVFPFNFGDAWDDDRGAMFLEWGQEPTFKEWADAPKYRTMKVSEMLEQPEEFVASKCYIRASIDIDLSYDEAQFVKDVFTQHFSARKIDFIPINKANVEDQEFDESTVFQSIDQIVEAGLNSVQSGGISNDVLIEIYRGLI